MCIRDSAATVLEVISGRDPLDSTSVAAPVPGFAAECGREVKGLRVGLPKEYFAPGLDDETRSAIERQVDGLRRAGCKIVEITLPHTEYAIPVYYIVATAEASANLARFDGVRYTSRSAHVKTLADMYRKSRDEGFGAEVKRRILLGTYVLSAGYYDAYYRKAQQVLSLIHISFDGEGLPHIAARDAGCLAPRARRRAALRRLGLCRRAEGGGEDARGQLRRGHSHRRGAGRALALSLIHI